MVSVGPPRSSDQELLLRKKASIVLLRFVTTADGQPMRFTKFPGVLILHVVNIDTGDHLRELRAPTPEAKEEGWIYEVLSPSRYYFTIEMSAFGKNPTSISTRFFVRVPAAVLVVYAGSLPITCSGVKGGWISAATASFCGLDGTVIDETQAAIRVAQTAFAQYGPLATILLKRPQ